MGPRWRPTRGSVVWPGCGYGGAWTRRATEWPSAARAGASNGGRATADRKKTPDVLSQLRRLLREDLAGDPMGQRGLWTDPRLEQISDQLTRLGIWVCPNTVRRLLAELDIALHVNRKTLSGPQSPERDAQF